jgi:hypothetical protein
VLQATTPPEVTQKERESVLRYIYAILEFRRSEIENRPVVPTYIPETAVQPESSESVGYYVDENLSSSYFPEGEEEYVLNEPGIL